MKDIIALRRELHRHPEAGFTEFYTTSRIAGLLTELGWAIHMGRSIYEEERLGVPGQEVLDRALQRARDAGADPVHLKAMAGGYTGLIAVMDRGPGEVVTLRFDIDCVEVEEAPGPPYRSLYPGLMHACGHDGHTAVGVQLAKELAQASWQGRVNLVFQPAEEGVRGGRALSRSALLQGTSYFLAGHLGLTDDPEDTLYTNIAEAMSTSKWDILIQGESVHAALYPEQGSNALLAAADLVMRLYAVPRPKEGESRLNVGQFIAGSGRNVVAGQAQLKAETRGSTPRINRELTQKLLALCADIQREHQVRVETRLVGEAIYEQPSPELVSRAAAFAQGAELSLNEAPRAMTGSEDVFYYIRRVKEEGGQGIYLIFGTSISAPHHNPHFDFNEAILEQMVRFFKAFVLDLLRQ